MAKSPVSEAAADAEASVNLVIFDCDGVLVDSEQLIRDALRETMGAYRLPIPDDIEILQFRGRSANSVIQMIEKQHRISLNGFFDQWQDCILRGIASSAKAIRGVQNALRRISVPMCVASSGEPNKIRLSLETTGLSEYFDDRHRYSATQVQHGKPAPDLFLFAAADQGVAPGNCVVIEDAVPGVAAAVAAGMRAFGFALETPADDLRSAGATAVFDDMDELVSLLQFHGMPAKSIQRVSMTKGLTR